MNCNLNFNIHHLENAINGETFLELTQMEIKSLVPKLGIAKKLMKMQKSSVSCLSVTLGTVYVSDKWLGRNLFLFLFSACIDGVLVHNYLLCTILIS